MRYMFLHGDECLENEPVAVDLTVPTFDLHDGSSVIAYMQVHGEDKVFVHVLDTDARWEIQRLDDRFVTSHAEAMDMCRQYSAPEYDYIWLTFPVV